MFFKFSVQPEFCQQFTTDFGDCFFGSFYFANLCRYLIETIVSNLLKILGLISEFLKENSHDWIKKKSSIKEDPLLGKMKQ